MRREASNEGDEVHFVAGQPEVPEFSISQHRLAHTRQQAQDDQKGKDDQQIGVNQALKARYFVSRNSRVHHDLCFHASVHDKPDCPVDFAE